MPTLQELLERSNGSLLFLHLLIVDSLSNKLSQNQDPDLERDFQVVNRALRVLSACTQAVIRATDEITLLQTLCHKTY